MAYEIFDSPFYLSHNRDVETAGVNPLSHYIETGWLEGRNPSLFFDVRFYLESNPDLPAAGVEPLYHFLTFGWKEGRNPHPLFVTNYYIIEMVRRGLPFENPLVHFIDSHQSPTISPHPLFDLDYFRTNSPEVYHAEYHPFISFLLHGYSTQSSTHRWFDTPYYVSTYMKKENIVENPLLHYLAVGWRLNYKPHSDFDPVWYREQYLDNGSDQEPLTHFVNYGLKSGNRPNANGLRSLNASCGNFAESTLEMLLETELRYETESIGLASRTAEVRELKLRQIDLKRQLKNSENDTIFWVLKNFNKNYKPVQSLQNKNMIMQSEMFDEDWYRQTYLKDLNDDVMALDHFLERGVCEGKDPNPYFDCAWYLSQHPELVDDGINPLVHYIETGWKEGYNPSIRFDGPWYLMQNPDVANCGMPPLTHFLQFGRKEGRLAQTEPQNKNFQAARENLVRSNSVNKAREFRLEGEPVRYKIFSPDNRFNGIKRFHAISCQGIFSNGMHLMILSGHAFLEIPPSDFPNESIICFHIELESFCDAIARLQYVTLSDQRYENQKSQVRSISSGISKLQFLLGSKYLVGAPRLVFEGVKGRLIVKSIEISTFPRKSNDKKVVSFIIPCFNHGGYIQETIDSIHSIPDRDNYEIIIVNDGSTDDHCIRVLNDLEKDGLTVIHQTNQGLGRARNRGIERSEGKYILPVDADNKIRSIYYERAVEILETDPEMGVVFSDVQLFGEKSEINKLDKHRVGHQFIQNKIDACAAFRREVWEDVGGYREFMIGYQDWEFWAAVDSTQYWKFYHLPQVGFDYRANAGSMVSHTLRFHYQIRDYIAARHVRNLVNEYIELDHRHTQTMQRHRETGSPVILSNSAKPLVTVIAPNFNKEPFLRTRLDSIYKQTYRNFEVILLDDASSDKSQDILRTYAKRYDNTRCIFNDENSGGVFRQWKRGIKEAQGELIWIAECDDYADIGFLANMVPHLMAPFNIGIAYAMSAFVDEDDDVFESHLHILKNLDDLLWKKDFIMEGREFVRRYMRRINCIPNASGVLFKRECFDDINWEKTLSYRVCGDWYIYSSILLNNYNIYFCHKPLNYFRFDRNTLRSKNEEDLTRIGENLRIIKHINDFSSWSDSQKNDCLFHFSGGLQNHLNKYGAEVEDLHELLMELFCLGGPTTVICPIKNHEDTEE